MAALAATKRALPKP